MARSLSVSGGEETSMRSVFSPMLWTVFRTSWKKICSSARRRFSWLMSWMATTVKGSPWRFRGRLYPEVERFAPGLLLDPALADGGFPLVALQDGIDGAARFAELRGAAAGMLVDGVDAVERFARAEA